MAWNRFLMVAVVFVVCVSNARMFAQAVGPEKVVVIAATDFASDDAAQPLVWSDTGVYAPGGYFRAAVHIPDGAEITRVELESCNAADISGINVELLAYCLPGEVCPQPGVLVASQNDCVCERVSSTAAFRVDNRHAVYYLAGGMRSDGADVLRAMRVYYRNHITAAPFSPTFSDVPITHPFFRFIEALHAAGVTAGCGEGRYCPNAGITRGQFAVMLATATGLYTPRTD